MAEEQANESKKDEQAVPAPAPEEVKAETPAAAPEGAAEAKAKPAAEAKAKPSQDNAKSRQGKPGQRKAAKAAAPMGAMAEAFAKLK